MDEKRNKKLGVGIIGLGNMGTMHYRAYLGCRDARVVAVTDARPEVLKGLGQLACSSTEELLGRPEVEVVSICVPPNEHFSAVMAALRAGKAVLCEKPLAVSLSEAQQMVALARKRRLLLLTAFCHRFHPTVLVVKKLIDEGRIGRVIMFRCQFTCCFEGVSDLWFSKKSIAGGGVIIDNASHAIDLFHYLVGPAVRVTAFAGKFIERIGVEDTAAILLQGKEGAQGVIQLSWATAHGPFDLEVLGEKGAIEADYWNGPVLLKTDRNPQGKTFCVPRTDRFTGEVCNFVRAALGKEKPVLPDGLAVQEAIEEVYRDVRRSRRAR